MLRREKRVPRSLYFLSRQKEEQYIKHLYIFNIAKHKQRLY